MQHNFIQKVMLTLAISFACAGGIWIFRHVIVAADESVNGRFRGSTAPAVIR